MYVIYVIKGEASTRFSSSINIFEHSITNLLYRIPEKKQHNKTFHLVQLDMKPVGASLKSINSLCISSHVLILSADSPGLWVHVYRNNTCLILLTWSITTTIDVRINSTSKLNNVDIVIVSARCLTWILYEIWASNTYG